MAEGESPQMSGKAVALWLIRDCRTVRCLRLDIDALLFQRVDDLRRHVGFIMFSQDLGGEEDAIDICSRGHCTLPFLLATSHSMVTLPPWDTSASRGRVRKNCWGSPDASERSRRNA